MDSHCKRHVVWREDQIGWVSVCCVDIACPTWYLAPAQTVSHNVSEHLHPGLVSCFVLYTDVMLL